MATAAKPNDTITMHFKKSVLLTLNDGKRIRFERGLQPVPVELKDHWWLARQGASVYDAQHPPVLTLREQLEALQEDQRELEKKLRIERVSECEALAEQASERARTLWDMLGLLRAEFSDLNATAERRANEKAKAEVALMDFDAACRRQRHPRAAEKATWARQRKQLARDIQQKGNVLKEAVAAREAKAGEVSAVTADYEHAAATEQNLLARIERLKNGNAPIPLPMPVSQ